MLDNITKITNSNLNIPNKNSFNIKLFADLHYCKSFDERKLYEIEKIIYDSNTDYICIPGDIIDNTNFLVTNHKKADTLLKWLECISNNKNTFLSLGSHDYSLSNNNRWIEDIDEIFLNELSSINNVHLMRNNLKYEDNNIIVKGIDPGFDYYYNETGKEDKNILIKTLKENKDYIAKLNNKVKILLSHSPIWITDPEVLDLIKEYDLILSGHMHNGIIPPIIDELIHNNKGLIAPNKSLFPNNARGIKKININDKNIYLVITSGITKLQECAPKALQAFNGLFPMGINNISINQPNESIKTYTYKK